MNAFEYPTAISEAIIENSLRSLQAFGLANEQADKMTRMMLDNAKAAREEGVKMAHKWAEFARENQRQAASIFNVAVRQGVESYRSYNQQTVEELGKQVERLTKQMEAMTPKVGKN